MERFDKALDSLKKVRISGVTLDVGDVLEILIIALILYYILVWMKTTRAWALVKGLIVICAFLFVARLMEMNTIFLDLTQKLRKPRKKLQNLKI